MQKIDTRNRMFSAWIGEHLARQKILPSLDEFLALAEPKPKQKAMTAEEFKQMQREINGR